MLSDINKTQQSGSGSVLTPILGIGALAVASYFGYKIYDKKREEQAINKAQAESLAHTLNIKKTNARIGAIENKAFVKGINSNKKNVTVNITDQAKKLVNQFYSKTTDKNGLDHYSKKSASNINEATVRGAIFETPLNSIAKLYKLYNIYTGENLKTDSLKLSQNLQAEIQAINNVAYKNFPQTFVK